MMKQNIFSLTLLLGSLLTGGCVSTVDEPVADAAPHLVCYHHDPCSGGCQ